MPEAPNEPLTPNEYAEGVVRRAVTRGGLPDWAGSTADHGERDALRQWFVGTHDIAGAAEALASDPRSPIFYDQSTPADLTEMLRGAGLPFRSPIENTKADPHCPNCGGMGSVQTEHGRGVPCRCLTVVGESNEPDIPGVIRRSFFGMTTPGETIYANRLKQEQAGEL